MGDLFTTPRLIFFIPLLDLESRSTDLRDLRATNSFLCIYLPKVCYFSRHYCAFPFLDITTETPKSKTLNFYKDILFFLFVVVGHLQFTSFPLIKVSLLSIVLIVLIF